MRMVAVVVFVLGSSAVTSADGYMKLTLATPKVSAATGASIDVKSIMATLDKAKDQLQPCYSAKLENDPHQNATATVTFTLAADGKISDVKAKGLLDDDNVCVVGVVSKLKFGKQKAKVGVTQTLQYDPPGIQTGAFASLTGTGDVSSGFDDTNIYGGLLGNEAGEMDGGFGYGRPGFGSGGGGTGWGTIGTGRYGTIGHGKGKGSAVPTISIGQPTTTGDLDKAIIRRYIKRNIQKITYCYEKQLLQKKGLAGTVWVDFTIGTDGKVVESKGSGMKDKDVESCVADVVRGIEFPKPKGGDVVVRYPFTFRPAG
jgi:hypothetical protein